LRIELPGPEALMKPHNYDESIIEHWRVEPRWRRFEFEDLIPVEQAPPFWKDLAFASVAALVLWVMAFVLVR
jgi:hypothetical protein